MIYVQAVSKTYKSSKGPPLQALKDIYFHVKKGEVHGLIGLSGAGKSTALRTLNLLERPDSGSILINGENILEKSHKEILFLRQKIGMIFQHFNLIANASVAENIAFPLQIAGLKRPEIQTRIRECLELVQLTHKANVYPASLSGGQKQRVAIARAIANHPTVLLADEPTSALDPLTKNEILSCLSELNQRLSLTIVIAAHEMKVIKKLCNRISLFKDGSIEESLTVQNGEIHPQTMYGQEFVRDF